MLLAYQKVNCLISSLHFMDQYTVSFAFDEFCKLRKDEVIGKLAEKHAKNHTSLASLQTGAWDKEYEDLHNVLKGKEGRIIFEYSIPGLPKTIDVILLIKGLVFIIEYKAGATDYDLQAMRQTHGYALRLKYYHSQSRDKCIIPILVATEAPNNNENYSRLTDENVYGVIKCNSSNLDRKISGLLNVLHTDFTVDWTEKWEKGIYKASPSIISAVRNVWKENSVVGFKRGEANEATRLKAIDYVENVVIPETKNRCDGCNKSIVFVTGVPGAGKTLVGLRISVELQNEGASMLSGNGPLVKVLSTALKRDLNKGRKKLKTLKNEISVDAIIRDAYGYKKEIFEKRLDYKQGIGTVSFRENAEPSSQHIIIFDEAQRAWDKAKMIRPGQTGKKYWQEKEFPFSEPGLLLWDMNQCDWGVFVCLVGGGQEIHVGEAGICEWLRALNENEDLKDWHIYMSDKFSGEIYNSKDDTNITIDDYRKVFNSQNRLHIDESLYLTANQRSTRSEKVSEFVEELLNCHQQEARDLFSEIKRDYTIFITRELDIAKRFIKNKKRMLADEGYVDGENDEEIRIGMLMSSKAARMRPLGYEIKKENQYKDKVPNWFLDPSENTISSNFLEVALNEFFVQGLELDVATVMWDADMRYDKVKNDWQYYEFDDTVWRDRNSKDYKIKRMYMKNAYRVLLTRARKAMVIYVPEGDPDDPTRHPDIYNSTYEYFKSIGFYELKRKYFLK